MHLAPSSLEPNLFRVGIIIFLIQHPEPNFDPTTTLGVLNHAYTFTRMIRHTMAAKSFLVGVGVLYASWMFFWSSLALAPSVEAWAIHRKGGARLIPQQSSVCVLCGTLLLTATTSLPAPATAVSWLDGISSVKAN